MDKAITNTWLLTFDPDREGLGVIENGSVGISDGEIGFVGPTQRFDGDADVVIDGSNKVTMPGLVNAHTHTRLTLLRGGAQDVPEIEWMNRALGPLGNHMTREDEVAGTRLGVLEGVKAGATTFCEYASEVQNLVENVYEEFGARVVATETINEVSDEKVEEGEPYPLDPSLGEDALARCEKLFEEYDDDPLVEAMYGPQALDMVSLETLREVRERARSREGDRRIHMHVAQGERERLQIEARYGASTVSVLDDEGLLDEFLTAAHCHGASEEEREKLVKRGVRMVGCPSSIGMIDGIVPPIHHYRSLGGVAGIGTDQAPGPGHHNMFKEMRTASILSKTHETDPTVVPAWDALKLATIGGARALGIEDEVGSLEVGKRADMITVDLEEENMVPFLDSPLKTFVPNLVHSTTGTEVDNVIVDGDFLVRDDEFVVDGVEEDEVIGDANQRARRVFEDAEEEWKEAGSKLVSDAREGWM